MWGPHTRTLTASSCAIASAAICLVSTLVLALCQFIACNDHRENTRGLEVHADMQAPRAFKYGWEILKLDELNGGLQVGHAATVV